jgi:CRP/FNR family transcriptional regulator, cyclic AMP receptor protein
MANCKAPDADGATSFPLPLEIDRVLSAAGAVRLYRQGEIVFSAGDPADAVFYVQDGIVKLSAVSSGGREAVVALLGAGEFFGDSCVADCSVRLRTAAAVSPITAIAIEKTAMIQLLRTNAAVSARFIARALARTIRTEDDLADQILYSSEKRLARVLLLLARVGASAPHRSLPKPSQEALAEMIGTTRSRVNVFMNRFRRLGFVDYNAGRLSVNAPALQAMLRG